MHFFIYLFSFFRCVFHQTDFSSYFWHTLSSYFLFVILKNYFSIHVSDFAVLFCWSHNMSWLWLSRPLNDINFLHILIFLFIFLTVNEISVIYMSEKIKSFMWSTFYWICTNFPDFLFLFVFTLFLEHPFFLYFLAFIFVSLDFSLLLKQLSIFYIVFEKIVLI